MTARSQATARGAGAIIRAARERRGATLREICVRLEVSPAYLCDIELGRRHPPLVRIWRWSKILGVDRAELLQSILQDQLDAAELPYRVEVSQK